jgi:glutaconate CoA-transferase subunit A
MTDKRATLDDVVGELESGMTIGFGGWGSRRKPMAVVRAILRSGLEDLTVVSYGGPDVGLLCAAGKARRVVFGFVTLDSIPLDPHFRAARQTGTVQATELDEGMFYLGLLAAAQRIPFLPTRAGLGSDVLKVNPEIKTVTSPYPGPGGVHEELVAAPAIPLDAAFVHMNRADTHGNGQYLGPDPFFDEVFLGAAKLRFVTAERVVEPGVLREEGPMQSILVHRLLADAVVATPGGAHFTSCAPDYDRDEEFQRQYVKAAGASDTWDEFQSRYLQVDEDGYQSIVRGAATGSSGQAGTGPSGR